MGKMIFEKTFDLNYPASVLFDACYDVISSIPRQELQIMSAELQTIYALLHNYPPIQSIQNKHLWEKDTTVSIFIHVIPVTNQFSKLEISIESFLVLFRNTNHLTGSGQLTLAFFMDSLLKVLENK